MNVAKPMDMSKVQVYGNLGGSLVEEEPTRVDKGEFEVPVQASEEFVEPLRTGLGNYDGCDVLSNDQFQDKLKEIDEELVKFDSSKYGDPSLLLVEEQHITPAQVDQQHVKDTKEECEVPRGFTGVWKCLLRFREVTSVDPTLNHSKRRVQEILEEDDDFFPLKKCCASTKSNETVEADGQPR